MLRPELRHLAEISAHALITGRVLRLTTNNDGTTDVLLGHCKVRRMERQQPITTHPEIFTDHLWVRMQTVNLKAKAAPGHYPAELRHAFARPGIELLERIRVLGVIGFYQHGDGSLGIGITKVQPVVLEQRLVAFITSALACFRSHPWRSECLTTLEYVAGQVMKALRDDWVVMRQPAAEAMTDCQRILDRARRDHQAEAKARRGSRKQVSTLPGLNPAQVLFDQVMKAPKRSNVEQLLGGMEM